MSHVFPQESSRVSHNGKHNHVQKSRFRGLRQSIRNITREYCAESSICGLKHLVDANTPYVERIIWIVTMIGAIICSISLVYLTFEKYYMAPLVTTQVPEGVVVNDIIFPAVSICSNNRISKKAVTELAKQLLQEPRNQIYNESDMLSMLFGLGQIYDLQISFEDDRYSPIKLHKVLGDYNVKDLMRSLTPKCQDMLLKCSWNDTPKECSALFDFRLTMNGYCCTFNYLRRSEDFDVRNSSYRNLDMYKFGNKSSFDYDLGLKVLVKFNSDDDFYYNMPLQGALIQLSDAYDFPDAPSGSFAAQVVSPNVQMSVLVSASLTEASRDIQHVAVALRGCLFYDESDYLPFYTHSDCMLKCRMLFLLDKCNCTPFNMPNVVDIRNCDLKDVQCLRKYYDQSITVRPDVDPPPPELELELAGGGISCPMCYPTCSKTAYSYEFNNVKIFSEQLSTVVDTEIDEWLIGANFTNTSIVHVKYASETADCYGQNVIMKWFDLFSNIGSTCGFVTGFSFVSVLEFIYFYTVKLIREIRSRKDKEDTTKVDSLRRDIDTATSSKKHAPVTRYRQLYWNELGGPAPFGYNLNVD